MATLPFRKTRLRANIPRMVSSYVSWCSRHHSTSTSRTELSISARRHLKVRNCASRSLL